MKKGDTIKCSDKEELINCMQALQEAGIYTDFLYEKDGAKGYWLIVEGIEHDSNNSSTKNSNNSCSNINTTGNHV